MSRRTSIHSFAFAKRATVAKSHVIATALLQLVVLEPTRADDVKPNECGLASVYSTLSEETAGGQDTSAMTALQRIGHFRSGPWSASTIRKTGVPQSCGSPIVAPSSTDE